MLMKRSMYITGYLFSVIWIAGIAFKLLHLMGAGMLIATGAFGVTFIFIPLFMINRY